MTRDHCTAKAGLTHGGMDSTRAVVSSTKMLATFPSNSLRLRLLKPLLNHICFVAVCANLLKEATVILEYCFHVYGLQQYLARCQRNIHMDDGTSRTLPCLHRAAFFPQCILVPDDTHVSNTHGPGHPQDVKENIIQTTPPFPIAPWSSSCAHCWCFQQWTH